jgi:hypothetical protein
VQPFLGLARDWRAMLFPTADDATFADGYAQTVTFALLLARTNKIDLAGGSLHEVGQQLRAGHSLMGKALQLLTDDVAADFKVTLDLLARVVNAVDWQRVRRERRDTYLHLYEHFLELYDNDLRKASGSYYTPHEVVDEMVRLAEEVLVSRLDRHRGFGDPDVFTVDPAMGTGTFLHTVLERVARAAERSDGPGAVAGAVSQAAERMAGFELQMGPYAVAELRTTELLALHGASPPPSGMKLYVTDTLDDPYAAQTQLGSGLQLIAQSRRRANEIKARANVTVAIGNPPYGELAVGAGGWVENGGAELGEGSKAARPILDDWFVAGASRFKAKLKNLYIYFWRWATWKVWESTAREVDGDEGVVCFISTAGYLTGPAFTGMREYLRRRCSEGWIIDLTPEGQTPDVPTRIFPGVRQTLAIGLFVRKADTSTDIPATIHYRALTGRQTDKFTALAKTRLDDDGWRDCRTGWTAPLTPAADGQWDQYPALADLFPWYSPGVFPTRTWVYAPSAEILKRRWRRLVSETDPTQKAELFKVGRDANLDKTKLPLPGPATYAGTGIPVRRDTSPPPNPVRIGYRAFDRQWVLPDSRLMDMPRRDLWAARRPGQVFIIEQHSQPISGGPGLVFSGPVPDFHLFNARGGRTLPLLHPDGSANLAPGLLDALEARFETAVCPAEVLAYVAAVVAHPNFTNTFADELTTPGIRVPITRDPALWARGVALGQEVVWLHTYGGTYTGQTRPADNVRYSPGDGRQPLALTPISTMPRDLSYDPDRQTLVLGDGEFGPVRREVWDYAVGGRNIIRSWFNYRKESPGGRKDSPLDEIHVETWDPDWTREFIDLLTVLTRLAELEPEQAELLTDVLANPVVTCTDLATAGVRWPQTPKDRKPRHSLASAAPDPGSQQTTLDM